VYLPLLQPDGRVDLIFDDGERGLQRTQCKTSRVAAGVLTFSVCSHTRTVRRDYRGQVDVFGVYSPRLHEVFIVPVEDVATRLCSLRLEPARNNQTKGIRWAEEYRLRPFVEAEPVTG
jgi:hypothetical protein